MEETNFIHARKTALLNTNQKKSGKNFTEKGFDKKNKKKLWIKWFIFFVFIWFSITIYGIGVFIDGVMSGKDDILNAQQNVLNLDFKASQGDLFLAQKDFIQAKNGLKYLKWMNVLPYIGSQTKAMWEILDSGIIAIDVFNSSLDIGEDLYSTVEDAKIIMKDAGIREEKMTFNNFPEESKKELLQKISRTYEQMTEIQVKLTLIEKNLDDLHKINNVEPLLLGVVTPFEKIFPDLIQVVDTLKPLSASVGELAGINEEKQWLVLFLNNTEMRPGGGFMGVYGLMTIKDAEISNMQVSDTYSVDKLVERIEGYRKTPPQPISEYLGLKNWYFRDANWSPDFAVSSRNAVDILDNELTAVGQQTPVIDGVIGITPTFAEEIMKIIGPITIEDLTFTDENFTELLEFEVEFGFENRGVEFTKRKEIVSQLFDRMLNKILNLSVMEWPKIFSAINEAFRTKQLVLFSFDEKTQRSLQDADWAGVIDENAVDDVLMITDANMGALKTDSVIERNTKYSIEKVGNDYVATLELRYRHSGTFDLFTSRYRDYITIYAPKGSEYISHSGSLQNDKIQNPELLEDDITVDEDFGMTTFSLFTSIEPGDEKIVILKYKLPDSIKDAVDKRLYQLQVIKQIGAKNHALTLDLDFGKKVKIADPSEEKREFGDTVYRVNTNIDQDRIFTVQF